MHLSVAENCGGADSHQHFGLGCGDIDGLRARLEAAGVVIENGPKVPCKRFFVHDPFGNRIEIHPPGVQHVKLLLPVTLCWLLRQPPVDASSTNARPA